MRVRSTSPRRDDLDSVSLSPQPVRQQKGITSNVTRWPRTALTGTTTSFNAAPWRPLIRRIYVRDKVFMGAASSSSKPCEYCGPCYIGPLKSAKGIMSFSFRQRSHFK